MATITCAICGTPSASRNPRLVQGHYQCRACLVTHPRAKQPTIATCLNCGREFIVGPNTAGKFCSNKCVGAHKHAQHVGDTTAGLKPYFARRERDNRAPGLTNWERRELLKRWVRLGKRCIYCGEMAASIDHLLPLVRGGTNYEGNLVPACRSCNSAKGPRTVTEWRYGKPAANTIAAEWKIKPRRKPGPQRRRLEPVPVQMEFNVCEVCGGLFVPITVRHRYCSGECSEHANRVKCRNRHRARSGAELDPIAA